MALSARFPLEPIPAQPSAARVEEARARVNGYLRLTHNLDPSIVPLVAQLGPLVWSDPEKLFGLLTALAPFFCPPSSADAESG